MPGSLIRDDSAVSSAPSTSPSPGPIYDVNPPLIAPVAVAPVTVQGAEPLTSSPVGIQPPPLPLRQVEEPTMEHEPGTTTVEPAASRMVDSQIAAAAPTEAAEEKKKSGRKSWFGLSGKK
jgi:hypothetical protein